MAKKTRKQLLKEPDEFLTFSQKLMEFILQYKIAVSCVLGIIFLTIIIATGIRYFADKAENNAFRLMEEGLKDYKVAVKEKGPEQACIDVEKQFQSILNQYSSRNGGKAARIAYANIYYNAGKFDNAIELYEKSLQDFNTTPSLKNLILSGLGYSYEGKKDYQNAVKYFNMIAAGSDILMKDEAIFNLGRLYDKMGQLDKSKESFKKLTADYPDSVYIDLVKERIAG